MKVRARDLELADTVELWPGPWGHAIVQKIGENSVTLFRPYGTTHDFSYTGGVVCLVGIETFTIPRDTPDHLYEVVESKVLK